MSTSEQPPPSYSQATDPPQATAVTAAAPPHGQQPPVQLPAVAAQPQVFWKVGPNGQPQMFYASAGMPVQPTPQAVAYIPTQPAMQPVTATLPVSLQPYSFLALSLMFLIVCSILNITALMFGIPALIYSLRSEDEKQAHQYESAKRSGAIALTLTVLNMVYTSITITVVVGITVGQILTHQW